MDVSIIIVSYRAKYFLEQTIMAAQEALRGLESEIIVVDNCSPDDTMDFVKPRFPDVLFVENKCNVGFARANNQAIAMARGNFTLILNPDTIITPDSIEQPLRWMSTHPKCAAIGVHMIDGDGVFLPESKRAFPSPWVSFCKIFGLSSLFPRSRFFAKYHLRYLDEHQPHAVDILAGAYMFCRTSLLRQLQGFDEDFFMYGEDIDLSYRMLKAGYENWYLPVNIVHYKGESTKKDSMRYVRVFYNAMLIFYRKHFPTFRIVAYPVVKLGVWIRQSMAVARRAFNKLFASKRKGLDGSCWVVLSTNPQQVAEQAGIAHYLTTIPNTGKAQVLLDDASYSYSQIVTTIATHSRKGLNFHIYSHHNGIVISPKMGNDNTKPSAH